MLISLSLAVILLTLSGEPLGKKVKDKSLLMFILGFTEFILGVYFAISIIDATLLL